VSRFDDLADKLTAAAGVIVVDDDVFDVAVVDVADDVEDVVVVVTTHVEFAERSKPGAHVSHVPLKPHTAQPATLQTQVPVCDSVKPSRQRTQSLVASHSAHPCVVHRTQRNPCGVFTG
jgi:hypothetical protein